VKKYEVTRTVIVEAPSAGEAAVTALDIMSKSGVAELEVWDTRAIPVRYDLPYDTWITPPRAHVSEPVRELESLLGRFVDFMARFFLRKKS
jgi:hypothetical protein